MIASSPPLASPCLTSSLPDIQFGRLSRDMGRNRATCFSLWTSSTSRKFCRPIFHDGENGREFPRTSENTRSGEKELCVHLSLGSLCSQRFENWLFRLRSIRTVNDRVLKSWSRETSTRRVDIQSNFFLFCSVSLFFLSFFFFFLSCQWHARNGS